MNTENKIILRGVWTDEHEPYFTGEMVITKNGQKYANHYIVDTLIDDMFNLKSYLNDGSVTIQFIEDYLVKDIAENERDMIENDHLD